MPYVFSEIPPTSHVSWSTRSPTTSPNWTKTGGHLRGSKVLSIGRISHRKLRSTKHEALRLHFRWVQVFVSAKSWWVREREFIKNLRVF